MRQLFIIIGLLLGLTMTGTIGLKIITGATWLDCLYMTVITLTTVGYSESIPLDETGRLFIVVFLVLSLGTFTYSAFSLGQLVVNARMRSLLERRRMHKAIEGLRGHYIVCGHGRMGSTICRYLDDRGRPFIVIDVDADLLRGKCEERGWLYLVGDATDDEVLLAAGIDRAKALAAVLPTDADNVYVVLSARMLASDLQIISRASDEKASVKMQRAGATRIVSPFSTGAVKMARFMLSPHIEDFLEIADARGNELELADVLIGEDSPYVGKTLSESDLRARGVMVIGIRRASGERLMPPPGTAIIEPGDCLFAFGSADAVNGIL